MTRLSIRLTNLPPDLAGFPVQLVILNETMNTVFDEPVKLSSESIFDSHSAALELRQGNYLASIHLPSGGIISRRFVLQPDEQTYVVLPIDSSRAALLGPEILLGKLATTSSATNKGKLLRKDLSIRIIELDAGEERALPNSIQSEDLQEGILRVVIVANALRSAVDVEYKSNKYRLFLPPTPGHPVSLLLYLEKFGRQHELRCTLTTDNKQAESLLAYWHYGNFASANSIGRNLLDQSVNDAVTLFHDKRADVAGACVGAYYLLSVGQDVRRYGQWFENLSNWFPTLPDAHVLRCWYYLRIGDNEANARASILRASAVGIPTYSKGLRMMIDALHIFNSASGEDPEIQMAFKSVVRSVGAIGWRCPYTLSRQSKEEVRMVEQVVETHERVFQTREPNVKTNSKLRIPQIEGFERIREHYKNPNAAREVCIVLPVGCGKSGLLVMAPFATKSKRALVVAPGLDIAEQLERDLDPTNNKYFYKLSNILQGGPYPEPAPIRSTKSNIDDLRRADIVITNIQQLAGRWLNDLPRDFFDLILVDEAHHNVASSWETLRSHFPEAKIINFSATPVRADGQKMAGDIIYSYPVVDAMKQGYVKWMRALMLNPKTLRYVRQENGNEQTVSLEEVIELGEQEAKFRRGILTSPESLMTIVDASITELSRLRDETEEPKLKIIAAALNYDHCSQIVEAYRSKNLRAEFVHSREGSDKNKKILKKLTEHELDVIVQVKKLNEGFDHPYLAVAAVFAVFENLSPFVQFVGRIMRVIKQNDPVSILNHGSVVFHAGANIAKRWADFQEYSQADQEFYDQLLPLDPVIPGEELVVDFGQRNRQEKKIHIKEQTEVAVSQIPLFVDDDEAQKAVELLRERGFTAEDFEAALKHEPVPTTEYYKRNAARYRLNERVELISGGLLKERKLNPKGRDLDKKRLGKDNFQIVKSAIDQKIKKFVGKGNLPRHKFTMSDFESIDAEFDSLIQSVREELFNG